MKKYILITLCVMPFCKAAEHQSRAGRIPRNIHWDMLIKEHYKDPTSDSLNLSAKNVKAIPAHIQGLQSLLELYLARNQITSIPENIQGLQNLRKLFLLGNQITSIPDNIQGLQNLQVLNLIGNPIAPKTLPDGRTLSAQEQIKQLQDNINATRGANQPQLQILF